MTCAPRWFTARSDVLSGSFLTRPPRKYQHSRVALQSSGQNLGSLHAETNAIILDRGDRRLGDARHFGELVLAHLLKLAKNPDGLPDGHGRTLLGGAVVLHHGLR